MLASKQHKTEIHRKVTSCIGTYYCAALWFQAKNNKTKKGKKWENNSLNQDQIRTYGCFVYECLLQLQGQEFRYKSLLVDCVITMVIFLLISK